MQISLEIFSSFEVERFRNRASSGLGGSDCGARVDTGHIRGKNKAIPLESTNSSGHTRAVVTADLQSFGLKRNAISFQKANQQERSLPSNILL